MVLALFWPLENSSSERIIHIIMGILNWLAARIQKTKNRKLSEKVNSPVFQNAIKMQMQSSEFQEAVQRRSAVNAWIAQRQGLDPTKIYDFDELVRGLGGYEHVFATLEKEGKVPKS